MPSKEQSVREAQKEYFLRKSEERIRSLKEKGADDVAVSKDPQVKRYKAKIKQINAALQRIDQFRRQTETLQQRKEQKRAEKEAARAAEIAGEIKKKEKKKAEEEAPPAKGKKKAPAAGKAPGQAKAPAKKK
ncbi:MAG: hypothetical protein ACP5M0_07910 [Desulfomonilaceae bacterium]